MGKHDFTPLTPLLPLDPAMPYLPNQVREGEKEQSVKNCLWDIDVPENSSLFVVFRDAKLADNDTFNLLVDGAELEASVFHRYFYSILSFASSFSGLQAFAFHRLRVEFVTDAVDFSGGVAFSLEMTSLEQYGWNFRL